MAFSGIQTRAEGARIIGRLGFSGHPMLEHFRFIAARTSRTPKMTIPAPSALYGRVGRGRHQSRCLFDPRSIFYRSRVLPIAMRCALSRTPVAATSSSTKSSSPCCATPGYRAVQEGRGDDPQKLAEIYADMINTADIGHPCRYDHHDASLPRQLPLHPHGQRRYDAVATCCSTGSRCTAISWNMTPTAPAASSRCGFYRRIAVAVLGLVTTKTGQLESKDEIKRRIGEAAQFADIDQLCLSPQCGFASTEEGNALAEDEQWAKLAMIVEVASEIWR